MRITGLGVIEEACLEFSPAFTVVTGETGAGKSMLVTGLALLAGARADSGLQRAGAARGLVEGRFRPAPGHPHGRAALARAQEAGAQLDEGGLLAARSLTPDGRSRAYLGGQTVPAGVLGEVVGGLVAVHGQSDQLRLLRPAEQRSALDRFGGDRLIGLRERYAARFEELGALRRELARLERSVQERTREVELLRVGLAEVERVAPRPGEDVEVAGELSRLEHAEGLRAAALGAHEVLSGNDGGDDRPTALGLLGAARRHLGTARGHDRALDELADRVEDTALQLADAAADLAGYGTSIEADPGRLAQLQDRRSALTGLCRTHGCDVGGVLAWATDAATRLAGLDGDGPRIDELREREHRLVTDLALLAEQLHGVRVAAGERFGAAVGAELRSLAMPHAQVRAEVSRREDPAGLPGGDGRWAYGATGCDEVDLLLVPHAGAPARPLARGASGGELSRVMLAVEVVFADSGAPPTLIFDEVDAGVGGRAAVEVGRRLARLARRHQVICVTHLPQVAAFADRHLRVVKAATGQITASGVELLDGEDRLRELSRMLAGMEDSASARAHAEELLAVAAAEGVGRAAA